MQEIVVRCPECGSTVRFPVTAPATSPCAYCRTALDLSGFLAAARVPVAPQAVEAMPDADRPAVAHHHHHGLPRRRESHAMVVLVIGFLAIGVFVVVAMALRSGDSMTTAADRLQESVAKRERDQIFVPPPPGSLPPGIPIGPPPPGAQPPVERRDPDAPDADGPKARRTPPSDGSTKPPVRRRTIEIKTYPYLPDVSAEEQNRIEDRLRTALDVGAREGRLAEKELVRLGTKAAPRLISEFKPIVDSNGLEKPEGQMRAMVLDRVLRQIDGVQERLFGDLHAIHVDSTVASALDTIRNWNWWWDTKEYEKHPRKPWDPAVDEKDAPNEPQ